MSEFFGPYPLTASDINTKVQKEIPGVYLLGPFEGHDTIRVHYTGRSDVDVSDRLHSYVGKYNAFLFHSCSTAIEAYECECVYYHRYNAPDNDNHPAPPGGTNRRCPVCGA